MKPTRSAFTLIELLVVIAIIGILMALLFPAVNGALDAARKAQAKNDVTQIATAVVAYETEYGKLPGLTGSSDPTITSTKDLFETLSGISTNENPRKIVFIEISAQKKGKSGTNSSGVFLDPWGGAYVVALDGDYNNTLDTALGDSKGITAPSGSVRKKVAVWNKVSDHTNAADSVKKRRSVVSWE